jgi:heme/copper-type cytochrome/quinol oxidase subunit 2
MRRALSALVLGAILLLAPRDAHASLMSPEMEDSVAGFLAVVILFVVPIVLIVLFWLVHILPEQIAHKRHHPQFEAIRTLCLLSLVFGGLLWPLAWIWAYSRPVLHKMAYGTDKLVHGADEEHADNVVGEEIISTRTLPDRLAQLEARGVPPAELAALRQKIEALEAEFFEGKAR